MIDIIQYIASFGAGVAAVDLWHYKNDKFAKPLAVFVCLSAILFVALLEGMK